MKSCIYILTNKPYGTLYVGVTKHLNIRLGQHLMGQGSIFAKQHNLTRLVYAEQHVNLLEAVQREKAMKKWRRDWKIQLIERANPRWEDWSLQFD